MTFEQVLAALVLAVCVGLLAHHFVGARRQAKLRWWWNARAARARQGWHRLRLWRRTRQLRRAQNEARAASEALKGVAAREAADVIERARRRAQARGGRAADGAHNGADHGAEPGADPAGPGPGGAPRKKGDNVVRPQRFGNRRNDLH
jgi:hypothetical protein